MKDTERRQLISAALDLADLVDGHRDDFTSPHGLLERQYGAAGLVRGCGLLRAAIVCHDAAQNEAVGVLCRAILESWITGAYVLFGGREAYAVLEAERLRNERNLVESNEFNAMEHIERREADFAAAVGELGLRTEIRSMRAIAERLGQLIEDATQEPANTVRIYNLVYRGYSTRDTHGLDPLERQLDSDRSFAVMRDPEPWIETHNSVAVALLLLSHLATWVFDAFGLGIRDIEQIGEAIAPVLEKALATVFENAPPEVVDALPTNIVRPGDDPAR